jgi:uncharacterized protein YndB with AHSA1/START domain
MERKTKIHAEDGQQDLTIVREFDLPLELLFKAYQEADLFEKWMGTNVLKLENRPHGSYRFETSGPDGTVVFAANGTIHEFVPNSRITRTFEMENTPFPVQLEFLEFTRVDDRTSRLWIHTIFRSNEHRDNLLQMPFEFGLNIAHDRLQEIVGEIAEES